MKKSFRKTLALLLAVMMIVSIAPLTASAEETYGDLTYKISNGEVTITDCDESFAGEMIIPETIDGYPVTAIGNSAFYNCSSLKNITIPDSVTSIGKSAFFGCDSLKSITIPKNVTSIGDGVFNSCDLLESIIVDENNLSFVTDEYGVLFNYDKTELFRCLKTTKMTTYSIPDSVKVLRSYAFSGCSSLESVYIPEGVTTINHYAFGNCSSIKEMTLPDSITSIGSSVFFFCNGLEKINIPANVKSIGAQAFEYCTALENISIPATVTSIGERVFNDCIALESITVAENNPNYLSDDYGVLFNKDKTMVLQYPAGNDRAEYSIPDSVTKIADHAFFDCYLLKSLILPDSITIIDEYALAYCRFESITIPDSVQYINSNSFESCKYLKNITIPESVVKIDHYAFYNCIALESITILNPECEIYDVGNAIYSGATIYGYCGSTAQAYAEKYDRNFVTEHYYVADVTFPTCTEQGFTTFTCSVCGDSYVADYTDATGHNYIDSECADCGNRKDVASGDSSKTDCACACHTKNLLIRAIYKVIITLCKIFRLNHRQFCGCGVAHW